MLQHYSPYKVAENFNLLATLAPGRVDLGIGRAPGGLPRSTRALQQGHGQEVPSLTDKVIELEKYIHDQLEEDHPLAGLKASPVPDQPAELYLLGTTVASAQSAAERGLPYVFALFINSDESVAREALQAYREHFRSDKGAEPQTLLALSVIVADTDEEARKLASDFKAVKIHLASGKTYNLGKVEQAEEFGRQSGEAYTIEVKEANIVHGSGEKVRRKLLEIQQKYEVDEFIITSIVKDFEDRIRSFEQLSHVFIEITAQR
jgi:luciferase family oxidoreductase group 1